MLSGCCFVLCLLSVLSKDFAPSNKAVMAGEKMTMKCLLTNHSKIQKWSLYNHGRITSTVFRNEPSGRFLGIFTHFDAEINANGPVTISANSTKSSDGGIYICHCESDNKDVEYSAHLIVLESVPMCESNITNNYSHSLIDGDHIWIQCRINFKGFWAPAMDWIQHGGGFGPDGNRVADGIETIHSPSQSVTSKLTMPVNSSINGSYVVCKVYFVKYNDTKEATADNIPDFVYTWNSSFIYVSHSSKNSSYSFATTGAAESSAITSSTAEKTHLVDWYLVSLSSFAALFVFFILVVIFAVACCMRVKKKVSDHYSLAAKGTPEMQMQESAYDIIPYSTSDNYETIGEIGIAPMILDCPLSSRPRLGTLPTPGYSGLMPVKPTLPTVYSRMENYETPEDIISDSILKRTPITAEVILERRVEEFKTRKTESPPKDSPPNACAYLEVTE